MVLVRIPVTTYVYMRVHVSSAYIACKSSVMNRVRKRFPITCISGRVSVCPHHAVSQLCVFLSAHTVRYRCVCHMGWHTLVLKCNKNNYDWLQTCKCMRTDIDAPHMWTWADRLCTSTQHYAGMEQCVLTTRTKDLPGEARPFGKSGTPPWHVILHHVQIHHYAHAHHAHT